MTRVSQRSESTWFPVVVQPRFSVHRRRRNPSSSPIERSFSAASLVTSVEGPLELNSHARETKQACQGNIILDDDAYAAPRAEGLCASPPPRNRREEAATKSEEAQTNDQVAEQRRNETSAKLPTERKRAEGGQRTRGGRKIGI